MDEHGLGDMDWHGFEPVHYWNLRPRGKEWKIAWQGAWHENTMMLRMRAAQFATGGQVSPAKLLVNQPAGGGAGGGS